MNLRIKYKTLKRENENLKKQMEILDSTISNGLKYQNSLECRVAAQNILILEMDKEKQHNKSIMQLLEKNNDTLHRTLNHKIKESMDLRFEVESLVSQNRSLSKELEYKNKGFLRRLFA